MILVRAAFYAVIIEAWITLVAIIRFDNELSRIRAVC